MGDLSHCIQYHHPRWEVLVLKVKALIWHIKCLNHHLLGASDRHTHHKSVNIHYLTWVLDFLISIF